MKKKNIRIKMRIVFDIIPSNLEEFKNIANVWEVNSIMLRVKTPAKLDLWA